MKKSKQKGKQRLKPRSKSRTARRSPLGHLLVIECDASTLDVQDLALGTRTVRLLKSLFPTKKIELLRTSTIDQTLGDFALVKERFSRFSMILVVGHSNSHGLQLAADTFVPWPVVVKWLAPFEPKNILLIACDGARFEGTKALFAGLKSLRELYGSPIALTKQQTVPLVLTTATLLAGKRISKEVNLWIQTTNFVMTRGVSYRWSRDEVLNKGNIEGVVWTQFADILNASG